MVRDNLLVREPSCQGHHVRAPVLGLTWRVDVCIKVSHSLMRVLCGPWTIPNPPSSEIACGQKRLSSVEGDYLVSRVVVALTSRRVASLSIP